jgi:hypothetical protein
MQVGKPNYNAGNKDRLTFFRLTMKDDGRFLSVRIAPPVKSLADEGKFAIYCKQHFGYGYRFKEGGPVVPQTFICIERKDRKSGSLIEECPECSENALRQTEYDAQLKRLVAGGMSEEAAKRQLMPLGTYLKEHNLDRKWNLLAKNKAGTWGILSISHKCYEALLAQIKELQALGIEDPLGIEGVWFEFKRTGDSWNTIVDTVTVEKIASGKGNFSISTDTLTEVDFKAIEALPELTAIGRKLTYDQIKMLVSSGGAEDVVKSVMESGRKQPTDTVRTNPPASEVVTSTGGGALGPTSAPTPQLPSAPVAAAPNALQAQIEALQKQLAASLAAQQSAAAPAPAPEAPKTGPAPSPELQKKLDTDVDTFLRTFGQQ